MTSLSSTCSASGRLISFPQAATTTVATQLPIKLPSARAMPINQSTERTSTEKQRVSEALERVDAQREKLTGQLIGAEAVLARILHPDC
jgi:hypothetical protein